MKRTIILLISIIVFNVHAATLPSDTQAIIDDIIAPYMQKNQIPGVAVELYLDGKAYSYFYGFANREKKIPVTSHTIFEIGSISKVITSLILAQEIDDAKMQLDDSVTKFILTLDENYEDITLKNLATHTSGLPFLPPANTEDFQPVVDDHWLYSNFGINTLAQSLEMATHKNFNRLFHQQIALPLKMKTIGLNLSPKSLKYYAQGYDQADKPVNSLTIQATPAGGIKASANDMQLFLSAAIGLPGTPESILYPMRMTQTAYVELPDKMQGLGWEVNFITADNFQTLLNKPVMVSLKPIPIINFIEKPKFDGDALIDKTGATAGFRAYIALIPNKKSGIIILANKTATDDAIVKTGRQILFRLAQVNLPVEDDDIDEDQEG